MAFSELAPKRLCVASRNSSLETLDLERLLAYQRLQRNRIVRQIGRAWWGLVPWPERSS